MKIPMLCALVVTAAIGCVAPKTQTNAKIKVLVLAGGHGFKAEPFFKMIQDN